MLEIFYQPAIIHASQNRELQEGISPKDSLYLENFHARWLDGRISKLESERNIGRQNGQQVAKNKEEVK